MLRVRERVVAKLTTYTTHMPLPMWLLHRNHTNAPGRADTASATHPWYFKHL
jgi:hypothetical protein